jgi:hypothetical protein
MLPSHPPEAMQLVRVLSAVNLDGNRSSREHWSVLEVG